MILIYVFSCVSKPTLRVLHLAFVAEVNVVVIILHGPLKCWATNVESYPYAHQHSQ